MLHKLPMQTPSRASCDKDALWRATLQRNGASRHRCTEVHLAAKHQGRASRRLSAAPHGHRDRQGLEADRVRLEAGAAPQRRIGEVDEAGRAHGGCGRVAGDAAPPPRAAARSVLVTVERSEHCVAVVEPRPALRRVHALGHAGVPARRLEGQPLVVPHEGAVGQREPRLLLREHRAAHVHHRDTAHLDERRERHPYEDILPRPRASPPRHPP
mmetsp:Transcript_48789/g.158053  ORF Transcript_48789/g.158053 Transcript_48789/m.158053 type:complete len:213 (-) Transcript_48789:820-1458(-)